MEIRSYTFSRSREVADLFHQAVHAIDTSVYTSEQKEAWAPTPTDYDFWSKRLDSKKPFLAIIDNQVVGFIELDADGHIDCTYTHPDFQGRGVATALCKHVFEEAKRRGIERLYVEASVIARPVFEHLGFVVVKRNEVKQSSVALINFLMEKHLSPPV